MVEINVDVAIIGAGTAGLAAYKNAIKYTDKVLIIENGKFGTTCARVGCMPSKLLIAAAESAHSLQKTSEFGINIKGKISIDGKKVMQRIKRERDRFVGFVLEAVSNIKEKHIMKGHAKFIDNKTLQIDDHTIIKAKSIIIATGSSPFIPPFLKSLGDRLVINDHIFDWDDLPESLLIFGSGVIGLEIGQALHRLGVKIKMFGKCGVIGVLTDPEILSYSSKTFLDEFYLDNISSISPEVSLENNKVKLKYQHLDGSIQEESFDYVLAATGRKSNLNKLGLENTDLELDDKSVPISDKYTTRCGKSSIFIAGDSSNYMQLLHESADEGKIAGTNAANFPKVKKFKRTSNFGIMFTDPQIATVGMTYRQLSGKNFAIGEVCFEDQGRSRIIQKNSGLLHIYADYETGLFLGAEMIAPDAEHLAHLLVWSHQQKMTIDDLLEMPFYHPVIEEGLRTALRDVHKKLLDYNNSKKKL